MAFYWLGQNGHFPQGRNEVGRGAPLFLLNTVLGNLTIAREKEEMGAKQSEGMGINSVLRQCDCFCRKCQGISKNFPRLVSKFKTIMEYQVSLQKPVTFLYTSTVHNSLQGLQDDDTRQNMCRFWMLTPRDCDDSTDDTHCS